MQAIKMEKPGSYDVLKVVDIDMPVAKTGELLIEVKATAVNRTDIVTRENKNLTAPYPILGVEIAGVVIENHSQDQRFQPGAKVCGLVNHGGYANYAVMPSERAMLIPENLDFEEAAGLPEVFLTAYQTLYWLGELKENETVLIHAGASGVGTAAIQLAKQLTNAKVIVTAGSQEKLDFCLRLGADYGINYRTEDFAKEVLAKTDGQGADVILDFVGASYWDQNLASIGTDGRWVLIGTLGGTMIEQINLRDLMQKRISLKGTLLTPRSDAYKAKLTNEFMEKVFPYFMDKKIKPIIDTVFPLTDVQHAHQYMENNQNIGKLILKMY